jgi:uncharacterized OsmC-like protein
MPCCVAHLRDPAAATLASVAGCVTYVLYGLISWRAVVAFSVDTGRRTETGRQPPEREPAVKP